MMEEEGEHSPKNKKEAFSNRLNMENHRQRDRSSDLKVCGFGEKQQTGFWSLRAHKQGVGQPGVHCVAESACAKG